MPAVENRSVAQLSGASITSRLVRWRRIGDQYYPTISLWSKSLFRRIRDGPLLMRLGSPGGAGSASFAATGGNMAKIETILVVGGGVAGLTTATALHHHGFTVELVERRQSWHALGAGFLVHANGMRMLLSLGLGAG